jgi:Carboxypeptidase regulatory-like domain
MFRLAIAFLVSLLASVSVQAMQATGSLSGRVLDPDGSVIERMATDVTLTHVTSGARVEGRLASNGTYSVKGVPPGSYNLSTVVPSRLYDPYQRAAVVIEGGKEVKLDLLVKWGMNLGTVGDDPLLQGADLRSKTKNVDGPVLRLHDGRPDLSGVWTNISDGAPPPAMPMQPWAQKMADELAKLKQDNAGAYCLPQVAVPSLMSYPTRFVQGSDRIIQIIEDMDPGYRQIFMDGRGHPDPDEWNPAWYGHSIGRWEGDTLVVDTVGYNEVTPGFSIHSEKLHVVERYTRLSHGVMQIELMAEDPEAWTGPYTKKWTAGLAEGTEIVEFVCAEGYASKVSQRSPWKGRP